LTAPADPLIDEAIRLRDARRFGDALRCLRDTEATGRQAPPFLDAERATLLARWGRLREAALVAARAVDGGLPDLERLAECVASVANAGLPADGLAGRLFAGDAPVLRKLRADILRSFGRWTDAIPTYRQLVSIDTENVDAWMALADCLVRTGGDDEALQCFARVIELVPEQSVAWGHVAAIHALAGRYGPALDIYDSGREFAASIRGQVLANHAITRFRAGDVDGCLALLLSFLPGDPDLNGQMQLGPTLLTFGEFEEGWKQYEFRWMTGDHATERPGWARPHWNGQNLDGKTIVIVREQGIGDFFQFARYLPMLKARGAKLLLSSFGGVADVAARLFGADALIADGDPVPEHDCFAFLLSLPRAFGTTVATIPPPLAGLAPTPERSEAWAATLSALRRPRVGVVWAGRPEHLRDKQRSMPLEALAPVLKLPGIAFVGLQKGPAVAQCEAIPESVDWTGLGPALDTLDDAIAVLDGVDLLVTVDTALAHIAATMGKPVWMLVAQPPDFRWLSHGATSPWYPSMRLFRQRVAGDWSEPVRELAAALAEYRDTGSLPSAPASDDAGRMPPGHPKGPPAAAPRSRLARALPMRHGFLQYDPGEPVLGASLEHYGEWLEPVLGRVLSHVVAGGVVVEAHPGAGAHALPLGRRIGPDGQLLLFEPRAFHRRMLENNLRANGLSNATMLGRTLAGAGGTGDADTVDDLGLDRLDALVLHEGTEDLASIVEAADETLWRCRPVVAATATDESRLAAAAASLRDRSYVTRVTTIPVHAAANYNRVADDRTEGATVAFLFAVPEERRAAAA
jgi:tetratricopeptide (TPR) repeat protein/precorrin-6B methylase 2